MNDPLGKGIAGISIIDLTVKKKRSNVPTPAPTPAPTPESLPADNPLFVYYIPAASPTPAPTPAPPGPTPAPTPGPTMPPTPSPTPSPTSSSTVGWLMDAYPNPVFVGTESTLNIVAIAPNTSSSGIPSNQRSWTLTTEPAGMVIFQPATGTISQIEAGESAWVSLTTVTGVMPGIVTIKLSNSTGIVATTTLTINPYRGPKDLVYIEA